MNHTHLPKNYPTMKLVAPFARSLETRTMPRLTPFSRRNPLALFLVALLALAAWLPAAPAVAFVESIVSVQYDPAGRVASVTLPSGRVVSYTYNEGTGEKSVALDGIAVVADTEFSVLGQPVRTTLAATHGRAGGETLRAYDDLGRLTSQETQLADESLPDYAARNLQYDAWGFLATYERDDLGLDAPILHSRDGQGRLDGYFVDGQPVAYVYDAAGNLRSRSAVVAAGLDVPALATVNYDGSNRRVGWSYDADGRLLEDDRYRYRYDRAGRLAALFDLEGDLVAHYLYDADGRRVRTMDDESIVYTRRDLAGGVVEVLELDLETGATIEHRETVLHAGQAALEVKTASGATTYEHTVTDRLGNPVARVEGGQRERQEYSPYGLQVLAGASEHRGAHGFTGVHEDDETGLVYMQARYYDPTLGRFQRPDPARDFDLWRPSTLNLYQYAYANPLHYVDPTGLAGECSGSTCPIPLEPGTHLAKGVAFGAGAYATKNPGMGVYAAGELLTSLTHVTDAKILRIPGNGVAWLAGQAVYELTNDPDAAAAMARLTEATLIMGKKSGGLGSKETLGLASGSAASAIDGMSRADLWRHAYAAHSTPMVRTFYLLAKANAERKALERTRTWHPVTYRNRRGGEHHFHWIRGDGEVVTACGFTWCPKKKEK